MTPLILLTLASAPLTADASTDFFKAAGPVLTLRIEVDKENLAALIKDGRKTVHAALHWNSQSLDDLGLHLKGAAGSRRDWGDKPALTLNSDKFKSGQTFFSMDKFHLNNSVQDDSYLNEIIFSHLFRTAGVPTARATHALVELNKRKVGLYVLKEGYDKTFLSRYYKNVGGNLYDGGFLADIDQPLQLDSGDGCEHKDLKALVAAATIKDHKERLAALDKLLEVDKFFALWVIEVMGADWDGYSRNRNNYRMYHDPASGKFTVFAHGKDQMFQNTGDSLVHGWGGLLARKLWETEDGRKRYIKTMKEVFEKQFKIADLHQRIDEYAMRLKDPLNAYQKGRGDQYLEMVKHYKRRVAARVDYLAKEIPKLKP